MNAPIYDGRRDIARCWAIGNGNRIVQAPGVVALSYEMLPGTRIFYTDGRPLIDQKIAQYLGDSRAHWEGEELVVETTNRSIRATTRYRR